MKLGDGRIHSDLVENIILRKNLLITGNPRCEELFVIFLMWYLEF